jgi:AraC-like DNA-binding protein
MDLYEHGTTANSVVDQIALHLRQHPCDLRHARKLMHRFRASATDVAQAIDAIAVQPALHIDPTDPGDKVLLHFLQYPSDVVDMRRVMQHLHVSERDVQQALRKLDTYIIDGGEEAGRARIDKK